MKTYLLKNLFVNNYTLYPNDDSSERCQMLVDMSGIQYHHPLSTHVVNVTVCRILVGSFLFQNKESDTIGPISSRVGRQDNH